MFDTPISRFRTVSMAEGVSFVLLLFVAMPLKYFYGIPEAVKFVGWAHGLLFIAYFAFMIGAMAVTEWGWMKKNAVLLASLIPFMPFFVDRSLKKDDEAYRAQMAVKEKAKA